MQTILYYLFLAVIVVSPVVFSFYMEGFLQELQGKRPLKSSPPAMLLLLVFLSLLGTIVFSESSYEYSVAVSEVVVYGVVAVLSTIYMVWLLRKKGKENLEKAISKQN